MNVSAFPPFTISYATVIAGHFNGPRRGDAKQTDFRIYVSERLTFPIEHSVGVFARDFTQANRDTRRSFYQ